MEAPEGDFGTSFLLNLASFFSQVRLMVFTITISNPLFQERAIMLSSVPMKGNREKLRAEGNSLLKRELRLY